MVLFILLPFLMMFRMTLELKNDSPAKDIYKGKLLNVFWCPVHHSYQKVVRLHFNHSCLSQLQEPELIGCGP